MRAIVIDPSERMISETEFPPFTREIREHLGGAFERVATLPNGDSINVVTSQSDDEIFCLGGSRSFCGYGIILGRRRAGGEFKPARSDLKAIIDLTIFGIGPGATRAFASAYENAQRRSFNRD
jgi:hypothetical protein